MDSRSCGKACLIGCIVIVVLLVIAGAGCLVCASRMGGGFFSAALNLARIQKHFETLEEQGWEVEHPDSVKQGDFGAQLEPGESITWRARENRDDDWTIYTWRTELGRGEGWETILGVSIIPITEAALDVHRELGLSLPEAYELPPSAQDDGTQKERRAGEDGDAEEDEQTDEDRHRRIREKLGE